MLSDEAPRISEIRILNVPEIPTEVSLSAQLIAENRELRSEVVKLSTLDPDANEAFIYELVDWTGASDNNKFLIVGDRLVTKQVLDYEAKPLLSIRIRSTDSDALKIEKQFSIQVLDRSGLTPTLDWNNPANIVYGTSFNSVQQNATSPMPGKFRYIPASGTKLAAGRNQTIGVNFTPDAPDYSAIIKTVNLNVDKAIPVLS